MTTRHRKQIREAVVAIEARRSALKNAEARLREAGRVLSAANEDLLRTALQNITNVLAALDAPADTEETKESREKAIRLAEAYSGAADDAGDGAYILSALLDLMSDESDEPDDLAILQGAFSLLMQWLMRETAEIGTVDDETEIPYDPWGMYWESARDRLKANGGPITRSGDRVRIREGRRVITDLVPLSEAAVREDGTTAIKLISPGWGSTGFYSPEVLEAGASVFPAGTKMFWDHPTLSEEWERPERSLRDLAAELTTDAVWKADGTAGAGLYAEAKVFSPYREVLDEIAPSIGVSIVAYGKAENGTAEGKSGTLITELVAADSVDFVTYPGAGGQVLSLIEAARQRLEPTPPRKEATETMDVEKDPKYLEVLQERDRLREATVLREAKDVVAVKLAESKLPEITRKRLEASLASNPSAKDGALDVPAFEKKITEAIDAETEYLSTLTKAGQIRGMGTSGGADGVKDEELAEAFAGLGMSESAAKRAAAGR